MFRFFLIAVFLCFAGAVPPVLAQRAVQSPLMVTVGRNSSTSAHGNQQVELKIAVRNMSTSEVEMRLEALFVAEPIGHAGTDGIYCKHTESATLGKGEAHDFLMQSDPLEGQRYQSAYGYTYGYGSKFKGYIIRVFANGQLVNVNATLPSLQKAGWDEKGLVKLGYSNSGVSEIAPHPAGAGPHTAPADAEAPSPTPDAGHGGRNTSFLPATPTTPETELQSKPVVSAKISAPDPVMEIATGSSSAPPADYQQTAILYNRNIAAYQDYLKSRNNPAVLKRIESNLRVCADGFEKYRTQAPAGSDPDSLIERCNSTIFAVQGTRQATQ